MMVEIRAVTVLGFLALLLSCCTSSENRAQPGERVQYTGKTFNNVNFSALGRKKGSGLPVIMEFERCTFTGTSRFLEPVSVYQAYPAGLIFRECVFEGPADGSCIQFMGQVSFGKCRFKKEVRLTNCGFMAPLGFKECTFDGEVQLQNAIFGRESAFTGSHFYDVALFQGARFHAPALFAKAFFHANADLTQCRFEEGAIFDYAHLGGNMDLSESRHWGRFSFHKTIISKKLDLSRFESLGLLRLSEVVFSGPVVSDEIRFRAEKPLLPGCSGPGLPAWEELKPEK